ncbi:hypothetical protein [Roseomonas xinghualingensis]|uniref:hypothetical protein n=1 Tax=Roseomonas xinghualingensis TaxID=2986475 RepID=UPI0021F1AA84|nr:hypothetical protein [Roseomonas sp. SXEYE001]MCV4206200.1 hypothetical protein [Roseomonas sp. SXEYE001]
MPFHRFETFIDPVAPPGAPAAKWFGVPVPEGAPPQSLTGFYWHFVRQAWPLVLALFVTGFAVAVLDSLIPVFIGRLVALLGEHGPETLWAEAGGSLLLMGAVMLLLRPAAVLAQNLVTSQGINPAFTSLIRWQAHRVVSRQGWAFFQEDFAGRIANRVMQAGPALRESVVQAVTAIWYILVYGASALVWLGSADWRLTLPGWPGSWPMRRCCASWCHACGTVPARRPSSGAC